MRAPYCTRATTVTRRTGGTIGRMRASDADREQVVAALQRHTAAGRLNLDEFAERVDRALASRTHDDLAAVVADLPREPRDGGRQLALAFAVALVAVLVLAVLVLFR